METQQINAFVMNAAAKICKELGKLIIRVLHLEGLFFGDESETPASSCGLFIFTIFLNSKKCQ